MNTDVPAISNLQRAACPGWLIALMFAIAVAPCRPEPAAPEPPAAVGRVYRCEPGPWGDIEYTRIVIEPPDEILAPDYRAAPVLWRLPGFDDGRLEQLWRQAGLEADQLRIVRDPARRQAEPGGMVIEPGEELTGSLNPQARAVIYNLLAQLPGNPLQQEPFRFRAEMVDEWFAKSGVEAETEQRVRALLYRRGNALLFSDPGLVLGHLPTPSQRVRLVKTLARKATILVKVRIKPDSDIEEIAAYWSTGKRRKDVRPLLQSLSRHPGGMTIDLAHLLPRFARSLLYTYPAPDVPAPQSPDCHWTSMNFFNDQADDRFLDLEHLKRVLTRDYAEVSGPPAMGDVLVLRRLDGEVVHSCVYLAADIVFTKNGQSHSIPWTLSTVADVQAFYPSEPPLSVRAYRRRQ